MLEILGITMKDGNYYRVAVKATEAMNQAWLNILNEYSEDKITFEQAMAEGCYTSNSEGYLVAEIEIDIEDNTYNVVYFFDDYEDLNEVLISEEEFEQCLSFINKWKDKLPDNEELCLGDDEWYQLIPDEIPWKNN